MSDLGKKKPQENISGKDEINIGMTKDEVVAKIQFVRDNDVQSIRARFGIGPQDARDWTVPTAKADVEANYGDDRFIQCKARGMRTLIARVPALGLQHGDGTRGERASSEERLRLLSQGLHIKLGQEAQFAEVHTQ